MNEEKSVVQRVAEVLEADYASEYPADNLTWRVFEDPARRVIDAAASLLRECAALIPPPSDDELYSMGFNMAIDVLTDAPELSS